MEPGFSEFSYGYAWTEAFVRSLSFPLIAAPVFPSLQTEGSQGGGYDLKLQFQIGVLLFVQFKLCDYIQRTAATKEYKAGLLRGPFYRFKLRTRGNPNQHAMLLQHEWALNALGKVFYVVPNFYKEADLNQCYGTQSMLDKSLYWRPSDIGPVQDQDRHHISFNSSGAWRCSTPHPVKDPWRLPEMIEYVNQTLDTLSEAHLTLEESSYLMLMSMIGALTHGHLWVEHDQQELMSELAAQGQMLDQIAYLARKYYNTTLIIVTKQS